MVAACPAFIRASWSSLKLASTPQTPRRHDRQQVSALRDIGSDPGRAIADIAIGRSTDFRVADIETRSVEIGPRLRHGARCFGDVGIQYGELLFCRGKGGLRGGDGCPSLRIERRGPLGLLPRAIIGKGEGAIAVRVDFGEI